MQIDVPNVDRCRRADLVACLARKEVGAAFW